MQIKDSLLQQLTSMHSVPQGAYSLRVNGKTETVQNSAHIHIERKPDGSGLTVHVDAYTKNESLHMPVVVSQTGLNETVTNDFYIGENAEVTIVAGCGIHNTGEKQNSHNGVHAFYVGKNAKLTYMEKHIAGGNKTSGKELNPTTVLYLKENATCILDTTQTEGVTLANRTTKAYVGKNATLIIKEKIKTRGTEEAHTNFLVELLEDGARVEVTSRSVASENSKQNFVSTVTGKAESFGHVSCDAIVLNNAKVSSTPTVVCEHPSATLVHEAAIGKIASDQLLKLMTLGLTPEEAENAIIEGFLQ